MSSLSDGFDIDYLSIHGSINFLHVKYVNLVGTAGGGAGRRYT